MSPTPRNMQDLVRFMASSGLTVEDVFARIAVGSSLADDPGLNSRWVAFGLSNNLERIAEALHRAGKRGVTKDGLWSALYFDKPNNRAIDQKLMDVLICGLRKRLAGSNYRVDTIWARGWVMIKTADEKPKHPTIERIAA